MSCNGTLKWIGGLFTGAAIGAAAGILLAPKSGEEMRAELNDSIQEKFNVAYDAVLNLGDKLSDQMVDLKADFSEWAEKEKTKEDNFKFDDVIEQEEDLAVVEDKSEEESIEELEEENQEEVEEPKLKDKEEKEEAEA